MKKMKKEERKKEEEKEETSQGSYAFLTLKEYDTATFVSCGKVSPTVIKLNRRDNVSWRERKKKKKKKKKRRKRRKKKKKRK